MHIFVITGPAGVGKSHLINELSKNGLYPLEVYTDRTRRPSEERVTDRVYISVDEFNKSLNDFLYWFEFQGNRYGYKKDDIEKQRKLGRSICFNITPTHLKFLLERLPEAVTIYLNTPVEDFDLLFRRMVERDISPGDFEKDREKKVKKIESRLKSALSEAIDYGEIEKVFSLNPMSRSFVVKDDRTLYEEVLPYILGCQ